MDFKGFSTDLCITVRLREKTAPSERAIEYFWTNMLLRKLSTRESSSMCSGSSTSSQGGWRERALEKALKEISPDIRATGSRIQGKYVWIFSEAPALLQKACALVRVHRRPVDARHPRYRRSMYDAMFSISIDSGLVDTDAAVAMPVIEAMVKLLDMRRE
jgi:hypothetical protein